MGDPSFDTRLELLSLIRDQTRDLALVSAQTGHPLITYLLNMAVLEASNTYASEHAAALSRPRRRRCRC